MALYVRDDDADGVVLDDDADGHAGRMLAPLLERKDEGLARSCALTMHVEPGVSSPQLPRPMTAMIMHVAALGG